MTEVPGFIECIVYLTLAAAFGLAAIWPANPKRKP